ncbi:MAG: hypothetical protein CMF69_04380 [Magnetovibrio sp.]|nr:hypothetical protein [Magnetovibrio sp.]|tara:strand:+ start:282 stop:482 length:201 start_codon:yes stop_codon:yes gene_type:complete
MPSHIKAALSIVVLCIGFTMHWYEKENGDEQMSWVVIGLAVFMVLAMWIFPETGKLKNKNKNKQNT